MKIDKKNGVCNYNDEAHAYWNEETDERYISVTTLIHLFEQEFKKEFWSTYKAIERLIEPEQWLEVKPIFLKTERIKPEIVKELGIDETDLEETRQIILDEWEETNRISCERGTRIHLEHEERFYKKSDHTLKEYDLQGNFHCKRDYYELDIEKGIYPEYLVHVTSKDGKLRIAGQIDLLIKDGNDIIIGDYKTNKEIKKTSYFSQVTKKNIMMKHPLNKIQDCNLNHYTLQLSTYAYMLQLINPEFNIKELKILHIDHKDKKTWYKLPYLKDEVELMMKAYKRKITMKETKEKNKKIEY